MDIPRIDLRIIDIGIDIVPRAATFDSKLPADFGSKVR